MLVVDVAIPFLFGWPSDTEVLASFIRALPGARVSFLVLGKVAGSLENFVATRAFLVDVHGGRVLLSTSHGSLGTFISGLKTQVALERMRRHIIISDTLHGSTAVQVSLQMCPSKERQREGKDRNIRGSGFVALRLGCSLGKNMMLAHFNAFCMLANLFDKVPEVAVSVRLVRRQSLVLLADEVSRFMKAPNSKAREMVKH